MMKMILSHAVNVMVMMLALISAVLSNLASDIYCKSHYEDPPLALQLSSNYNEKLMRVLVACEFSATIRNAFEERGHDAWSCDILPSVDGGNHFKANIFSVIYRSWDLIIAHPPCTYLSKVQAIHYNFDKWPLSTEHRIRRRDKAIEFFQLIQQVECGAMAIENPIPLKIVTEKVGMYDQIIHPYMFGDPFSKATCLWLRGLPKLAPTELVEKGEMVRTKNGTNAKWYHHLQPGESRARIRSKTFPGIAKAMAEQWG